MNNWTDEDLHAAIALAQLENALYDVCDEDQRRLYVQNYHTVVTMQTILDTRHDH